MALHSGTLARERVLGMGVGGSGKTRAWLSIAKKAEQLKSPGTFYVLDTDDAVERMLSGETFSMLAPRTQFMRYEAHANPKLAGRWVADENAAVVENPRLVVCRLDAWDTNTWSQHVDFAKQFSKTVINDDWIIVDLFSPAWGEVHDFFVDSTLKQSVSAFYIAARDKNGGALDGDKDWSNINRLYKEFTGPLARLRCHLFITTGVKALQMEGKRADARDVLTLFGAYGVKPEGQKHSHHFTHTILLFKEFQPGVWHINVVKDRERVKPETAIVHKDFAMDYLVPIAGWKLT